MKLRSIEKSKILLIGATGFLGSAIAKKLNDNGLDWVGMSKNGDIKNKIIAMNDFSIKELINTADQFDIIINASGSAKPVDFETNTKDTLNTLLESASRITQIIQNCQASKFIQISSAGTVYGECTSLPWQECDEPNPKSWYGRSKLMEEQIIGYAALQAGMSYLVARVSNPFGNPNKTTHGFIDVLINAAKNNSIFHCYKDANPIRDFIYAEDMADMILALCASDSTGIFNIGSGTATKTGDILNYVNERYGFSNISCSREKPDYEIINSTISVKKTKFEGVYIEPTVTIFNYIDKKLS